MTAADTLQNLPSNETIDLLMSLPPGTVLAQLDDGEVVVCSSLEEAERCFADASSQRRGWSRIAAAAPG